MVVPFAGSYALLLWFHGVLLFSGLSNWKLLIIRIRKSLEWRTITSGGVPARTGTDEKGCRGGVRIVGVAARRNRGWNCGGLARPSEL